MRQVIHLTRAEKRVQLDVLIFPLLAGMVPPVAGAPPYKGSLPLLVSGAQWAFLRGHQMGVHLVGQFTFSPSSLWLAQGRHTGLTGCPCGRSFVGQILPPGSGVLPQGGGKAEVPPE